MTRNPLLFVSNDASASGAPFLLLHLLRWLRANTKFNIKVALSSGGPLQAQFAELGPVAVFQPPQSVAQRIVERVAPWRAQVALQASRLRAALGNERFSLVYSNSLVSGNVLRALSDEQCPLISHVHELDYVIRQFSNPQDLAYTLARTQQFIACSSAVAENLTDIHGVDRSRIKILHEFIPALALDHARLTESAREIRAELHIPENAIVTGGVGTVHWRKGYDLFILMAMEALSRARSERDLHFVWVGDTTDRKIPVQIAHDLRKLGLEQRIHFVGHRNNPLDYIAMFDVLCLTSREDPYPLVVLEAAALRKPVICFDKSGGSPEFVRDDCGFIVPYLDLKAMAARVLQLSDDGALRETLGLRGESRVRDDHDVTVIAPRILEIIERLIGSAVPGR